MPIMGMLQRAAAVQTAMTEPPLVNITSSMAPESRNQTPEQTPAYVRKSVGGSTLKENLPAENHWHNWHMP